MSTPNSSSEEEGKSTRMEYNALLASRNRNTESSFGGKPQRDVEFWEDNRSNIPSTESLDFEEVESIIWRKVKIAASYFFFCNFRLHLVAVEAFFDNFLADSIICEDSFKIEEFGGQQVDRPWLGGGFWCCLLESLLL